MRCYRNSILVYITYPAVKLALLYIVLPQFPEPNVVKGGLTVQVEMYMDLETFFSGTGSCDYWGWQV